MRESITSSHFCRPRSRALRVLAAIRVAQQSGHPAEDYIGCTEGSLYKSRGITIQA